MATVRILQSLATLDWGGAEAMIMNIYRHIDRDKIQFDFMVNDHAEPYVFEEEIVKLGGRVFTVPKFNGKNLLVYRKNINQLFQAYPEWKIIHIHNTSSTMLFMDIAKKHELITIAHAHFDNVPHDFKSYVQKWLRVPIKNYADYLLACSKQAGSNVFRIDKKDVRVLTNAIETNDYVFNEQVRRKKRAELGLKSEVVLGHVGRMDEQKNQSYLIDIFQAYHELNPQSALLLIGHGELKEKLKNQARGYELSNEVRFLGVRSDVNELLQAMDVFFFPSQFEGLGLAAIEAQAAGLPVMASDSIPKEVAITDLVTFMSIDIEPSKWNHLIAK